MLARATKHARRHVVGYVALFFAMAPTAYASHLLVYSDDIVNGEVKSVDIGPSEVGAADIGPDAVTSNELAPESVRGLEVVNDSVTGNDLLESSLGKVPSAAAADSAANAGTLDGKDSTDFLASAGKAADAERLDGYDSSDFLLRAQGGTPDGGQFYTGRGNAYPGDPVTVFLRVPGLGSVNAECRAEGIRLVFVNSSGGPLDIVADGGATDPTAGTKDSGQPFYVDTAQHQTESITYTVGQDTTEGHSVATIVVSGTAGSPCRMQGSALARTFG